jgi:hypothetical protein
VPNVRILRQAADEAEAARTIGCASSSQQNALRPDRKHGGNGSDAARSESGDTERYSNRNNPSTAIP